MELAHAGPMGGKRAVTVVLWVLAVIVPGGFWMMAVYLAAKAARSARRPSERAQIQRALEQAPMCQAQ